VLLRPLFEKENPLLDESSMEQDPWWGLKKSVAYTLSTYFAK